MISTETERVQNDHAYKHHVAMWLAIKWIGVVLICVLAMVVAFRLLASTMVLLSTQLRHVDWGTMFNLGILVIMLAVAVAIAIPRHKAGG